MRTRHWVPHREIMASLPLLPRDRPWRQAHHMTRVIESPRLHGLGCRPFRDPSGPSGLPLIIGRWVRRYLSAPSHKKRLLPFHLTLPCGPAVVSSLAILPIYAEVSGGQAFPGAASAQRGDSFVLSVRHLTFGDQPISYSLPYGRIGRLPD